MPATLGSTQTLTFKKDGFNTAKAEVKVAVGAAPVAVTLTPAGKVYFLSDRTGKISLYETNLDGSSPEVILAGTGSEDQNTGILPNVAHPKLLALISSREGKRDQYGNLASALFLFDAEARKLTKIDDAIGFQNFRAWVGDELAYEKYRPDLPCPDIRVYNATKSTTKTFLSATGEACPRLRLATRTGVFYSLKNAGGASGFFFAKLDGGDKKRLSTTPSDGLSRREKQTILSEYYTGAQTPPYIVWEAIDLGSLTASKLPNGPSIESIRGYVDSPGRSHMTFIEERDGKSELYLTDGLGDNEKKLTDMGSISQFVQWVGDDYIVFSSSKIGENALYVIPVSGGKPTKVADAYRANGRTYGGGYNPTY